MIKPFKLFIKNNFPFIEDTYEALDEYGLLCKIVQKLNEVVESENVLTNNMTELQGAFQTLKDYVDNYFDNLDVQEEINNKLNEMAENGDLEQILLDFLSAQKIYSTFYDVVEDAESLEIGQKIRTLGFSNINDGGESDYIIVNSKNSTDFYLDISETLFARVILKNNEVNINSLGADNTGVVDSSTLINSVIQKINTNWLANKFDVNTINFNGTYLIENQIVLSPFVKLRGTGYVTFLTNVDSDSALYIAYLDNVANPTEFEGNKLDWLYNELINFDKGAIFKNINGELQGTCIEIGNREDWGVYKAISRYMLKNFRIQNYNIGILHNRYHNYIGKFENISFENNEIGVQYGTAPNQAVTDAGENMTYINCLFSTNENAVKWYTDGFDSAFQMCSFDFLNDIFLDSSTKGYKKISCNQCHFEGYRSSIMNTLTRYSMLVIENCTIVDSGNQRNGNNAHTIPFKNIASPIVFENNKYIPTGISTTDPTKMYFDLGQRIKMSNYTGVENTWIGFVKDNNILGSCFDGYTDGTYTNDTGHTDSQFNNWKFEYNASQISNQFEIVTDNYLYEGHKSLVVTSNSATTTGKNFIVTTDYIDVTGYTYLRFNDFTYNMRMNSSSYTVKLYDCNKNLLETKSLYHTSSPANPKVANTWYSSSLGVNCFIPTNCKYITVTVGYGNLNNSTADLVGTVYKIGGIVINGL